MPILEEKFIVALKWAVNIFNETKVPFQINGGLAAKIYGSNRPLFDIDFDVPEECFEKILPAFRPYLIYGPERFEDATWDIELMTAKYNDVLVDIGGAYQTKCFDKNKGIWVPCVSDLSQAVHVKIYGLKLPIASKQTLIEYKQKIARTVDLEDIAQITK
ncbi:MAG: hypothetical protein K0S63_339 [Gammaproteobacteria bacterium]|nr:hypothetical protein [Gammaproteobacteria bacterium]